MTHPGLALMVIVGVGLGAFLYYMFAANGNNAHQYGNESPQPPESPNPWNITQDQRVRRRKRGSSAAITGECPICLVELVNRDCSQLYPCRHEFHKTCIDKWREQGHPDVRNTCPLCREPIYLTPGC